jgi:hypothetical protein
MPDTFSIARFKILLFLNINNPLSHDHPTYKYGISRSMVFFADHRIEGLPATNIVGKTNGARGRSRGHHHSLCVNGYQLAVPVKVEVCVPAASVTEIVAVLRPVV